MATVNSRGDLQSEELGWLDQMEMVSPGFAQRRTQAQIDNFLNTISAVNPAMQLTKSQALASFMTKMVPFLRKEIDFTRLFPGITKAAGIYRPGEEGGLLGRFVSRLQDMSLIPEKEFAPLKKIDVEVLPEAAGQYVPVASFFTNPFSERYGIRDPKLPAIKINPDSSGGYGGRTVLHEMAHSKQWEQLPELIEHRSHYYDTIRDPVRKGLMKEDARYALDPVEVHAQAVVAKANKLRPDQVARYYDDIFWSATKKQSEEYARTLAEQWVQSGVQGRLIKDLLAMNNKYMGPFSNR